MVEAEGNGTIRGTNGHSEESYQGGDEHKLPVYTTSYGTRYVLPVDLLFTREEMSELISEARAEYSKKEAAK